MRSRSSSGDRTPRSARRAGADGRSRACRTGSSSAPRASSARTRTAPAATATPMSTGRPRRRARRGRTTRWGRACTPRCATGSPCPPSSGVRRRSPPCSGRPGSATGYRDDEQERAAFRRARAGSRRTSTTLEPGVEPLGVERMVAIKTSVLAFTAGWTGSTSDAADGPELVIVDYKTGRTGLDADDARGSQALALYAYAAERVFRRPCRGSSCTTCPPAPSRRTSTPTSRSARHLRRAEDTAARHHGGREGGRRGRRSGRRVPATPGPLCGWCDFRRHCPAGAAAPGKEPWAAVDVLADQPAEQAADSAGQPRVPRPASRHAGCQWCHGGRRRAVSSGAAALGRSFVGGGLLLARGAERPSRSLRLRRS